VIETTDLERLARLRYGDERAADLTKLSANLAAGLRLVAEAELGGEEEPDFLDGAPE
jgi:hypothetical protein